MKKGVAFLLALVLMLPFATLFSFAVDRTDSDVINRAEDIVVTDFKKMSAELVTSLKTESRIFDYIDAVSFEKEGHIQRLTSMEELNSYVFENADQTRSVYYFPEAVKYKDQQGNVLEKDITLKKSGNAYRTTSNEFVLSLPRSLSDGVSMVASFGEINLLPVYGKQSVNTQAVIDTQQNTVSYSNIFGSNTLLRYTPTLSGVKEDIILNSYTGVNRFSFTLNTGNLTVFEENGRYYIAGEKEDSRRISIGDIIAYDAANHFEMGSLKVEKRSAGVYDITVILPESFLTDSKTVYPVLIDPTLTLTDKNVRNSIEDAVLYQNRPDINFGTMLYNDVGSSSYGSAWTAVRFPMLYDDPDYIVPLEHNMIVSVIFGVKEANGTTSRNIAFYPVTTSWTESTVTYTQIIGNGNYSTTPITTGTLGNNQAKEFDITGYFVNNETSATADNGFVIHVNGYDENDLPYKQFCSSEYSGNNNAYKPYLRYTYKPVVSINSDSPRYVVAGETATLSATAYPSNKFTVTWSFANSGDYTYAEITPDGTVNALLPGTVTAVATAVLKDPSSGADEEAPTDTPAVTASYTLRIIPLKPGEYYIESAAGNEGKQAFIKPTEHSTSSGARIIANTMFNVNSASDVEGYNENCIWRLNYKTTNSDGYYTLQFEENEMYMGWDSSDAIRQYTSSSGSTARFDIAACSFEGNYRIALHGNTAGKVIALQQPTAVLSNLVAATYTSDESYDDEWIFHKVMPRSGSEKPHNKSYTIYETTGARVNCYGYALNYHQWDKYPRRTQGNDIFPYGIGEGIPGLFKNGTSKEDIITAILGNEEMGIKGDSEWYGYDAIWIEKEDRYQVCESGRYKVAFAIEEYNNVFKNGFHWYRQGANGIWSAKNGAYGDVTCLDSSGKIIFDPQDCDRGKYNEFVCYFSIVPLS